MARFLSIVLIVLLVAGGITYLLLERRHAADLEQQRQEQTAALEQERDRSAVLGREMAIDTTRLLAAIAASSVAANDQEALERLLTAAVQGDRLVGVIVVADDGAVISSSDLRYRGRTLDDRATMIALATERPMVADEAPAPGQVEVDVPLISGERRIGALRAFFNLEPLPES